MSWETALEKVGSRPADESFVQPVKLLIFVKNNQQTEIKFIVH